MFIWVILVSILSFLICQEGVTSSNSPSSPSSKRQSAEDKEITSASENIDKNSRLNIFAQIWILHLPVVFGFCWNLNSEHLLI